MKFGCSLSSKGAVLLNFVTGSARHRQGRARDGPEPGLRNAAGVWERDAHGLQVPQTVRHLRSARLQDHGKSLTKFNGTHSLLFCRVRRWYLSVLTSNVYWTRLYTYSVVIEQYCLQERRILIMNHPKEIRLDFPRVVFVLLSQPTITFDNHLSCVFPTAIFTLECNRGPHTSHIQDDSLQLDRSGNAQFQFIQFQTYSSFEE